ncbi:MAG TPA: TetR/AcrR family transcriptional regulator [Xanthobacteraceae bacterium]|nr:TetR/AcrR family transcriptional regulator [Xanthobacteraceae bacterium]
MARKPSRRKPSKARPALPPPTGGDRQRIVRTFMQLLAEKPIERIDLSEVARRASVSLARLREEFDTTLAILAAQMKETDREVLEGGDADMAKEPPRDRLFDVLMRRLEALAPHKASVRSLLRSARCNPGLALALNALGVRSMRWMLTAAGISTSGGKGGFRAQGLTLIFARTLRVWVDDDDPGLARSMAELDRGLARGQSWSRLLDDLCAVIPTLRPRRRRRRARDDEADEAAAA